MFTNNQNAHDAAARDKKLGPQFSEKAAAQQESSTVDRAYTRMKEGGEASDDAKAEYNAAKDAAERSQENAKEAGQHTKKAAGEVAGSVRDKATDTIDSARQSTEEAARQASEKTREVGDAARDAAKRTHERVVETQEEARAAAQRAHEKAQEMGQKTREQALAAGDAVSETAADVSQAVAESAEETAERLRPEERAAEARRGAPNELHEQQEEREKGVFARAKDLASGLAQKLNIGGGGTAGGGGPVEHGGEQEAPRQAVVKDKEGEHMGPDYDAAEGAQHGKGVLGKAAETANAVEDKLQETREWVGNKVDEASEAWTTAVEPQNEEEGKVGAGLIPSNTQEVKKERQMHESEKEADVLAMKKPHEVREMEEGNRIRTTELIEETMGGYGSENLAMEPREADEVSEEVEGGGPHAWFGKFMGGKKQ